MQYVKKAGSFSAVLEEYNLIFLCAMLKKFNLIILFLIG